MASVPMPLTQKSRVSVWEMKKDRVITASALTASLIEGELSP